MARTIRRPVSSLRGDEGMTLTELLVSMSILSVVLLVFLGTMASIQKASSTADLRGQNNDQARLALEHMDRLVRSGNVLFDPAVVPARDSTDDAIATNGSCAPNGCFLVYTQSNGLARCVEWRLQGGDLLTRSWEQAASLPTTWRTVASGLLSGSSFTLANYTPGAADLSLARTVNVVFVVGMKGDTRSTVKIEGSLTGRNTSFGYLANVC